MILYLTLMLLYSKFVNFINIIMIFKKYFINKQLLYIELIQILII